MNERLLYLIAGMAAFAASVTVIVGLMLTDERRQTTNTNTNTSTTTLPAMECLFATSICFTVPPDVVVTTRQ